MLGGNFRRTAQSLLLSGNRLGCFAGSSSLNASRRLLNTNGAVSGLPTAAGLGIQPLARAVGKPQFVYQGAPANAQQALIGALPSPLAAPQQAEGLTTTTLWPMSSQTHVSARQELIEFSPACSIVCQDMHTVQSDLVGDMMHGDEWLASSVLKKRKKKMNKHKQKKRRKRDRKYSD
mmetsp:Transcript_27124/g.55261  ORF Transcript_27124/g.55261 Transcript_27124/m.55261 type:complete len:177 (-) Transcript_27124:87-617(-)|eukprot:CAMPEP_0181318156 /NCGR_PEP_ID=MMETSP1101-20121128/16855_1 /TAXON_ID=46948 /ORGANISM="Rhodomonas abbreviata, Strain Caron Lab Isolate" /LENGTH=176 /DNA_ID=CAMNT_0023425605 /DNA_START=98 /DNA_END=628 /DNA_ORIENTATION=+